MTKLQITLTAQEADLLSGKAAQLGYKLTRFVKFLIAKEAIGAMEKNTPVFLMSKKAEKIGLQVKKDYEKGKTKEISSFRQI